MIWPVTIPITGGGVFHPEAARLVGERNGRYLFLTRGLRRTVLAVCHDGQWQARRIWRPEARAFLAGDPIP